MKTARIVLCIAAIAPSMLLAAKTEAPEQAPKSTIVAPAPATPPAATAPAAAAPAEAAPAMPPNVNRPPMKPGFPGILDVTRDAESKITKISLKVNTNLTYVVKKDELSLKMAENFDGQRVRIIGKLIDEVEKNVTNKVLKVDAHFPTTPRGKRPLPSDKAEKTTTPASTDHAPAVPAAAVTPPAPAAPAPAPEAPKK